MIWFFEIWSYIWFRFGEGKNREKREKERVLHSLFRLKAPLQAHREIKIYGLHIFHHQIVGTSPIMFSFIFFKIWEWNITFYWVFFVWLVLIPLCFGLLGSPWKCLFSQFFDFFPYFGLQKSLSLSPFSNICIHRFFFFLFLWGFDLKNRFCCWFITNSKTFIPIEKYMDLVEGRHGFFFFFSYSITVSNCIKLFPFLIWEIMIHSFILFFLCWIYLY